MMKNNHLLKIIILPIILLISGCGSNLTEGNLVTFTDGEVENKRIFEVIKIDDDEENNYYISVKIPKKFIRNSYSRVSKDSIVDEFVHEPTYSFSSWTKMLVIAKDLKFELKTDDINAYFSFRDDHVIRSYKPYRKSLTKEVALEKFDKITVTYEHPCKPNIKQVCLPGQKAFSSMIIFKGKNYFWSVEFLLNIPNDKNRKESAEMIKNAEYYIENCCKIFSIKKDYISEEISEKSLVQNFLVK